MNPTHNTEFLTFTPGSTSSGESGNSWTIEATQHFDKETTEDGDTTYSMKAPAGAAHVMLAAYSTDQQMLWATPGSIDENGNVVLPCEDFTNVRSITFFFLDGNYAPIEGSITRTIS